jgi:hypothetical protein
MEQLKAENEALLAENEALRAELGLFEGHQESEVQLNDTTKSKSALPRVDSRNSIPTTKQDYTQLLDIDANIIRPSQPILQSHKSTSQTQEQQIHVVHETTHRKKTRLVLEEYTTSEDEDEQLFRSKGRQTIPIKVVSAKGKQSVRNEATTTGTTRFIGIRRDSRNSLPLEDGKGAHQVKLQNFEVDDQKDQPVLSALPAQNATISHNTADGTRKGQMEDGHSHPVIIQQTEDNKRTSGAGPSDQPIKSSIKDPKSRKGKKVDYDIPQKNFVRILLVCMASLIEYRQLDLMYHSSIMFTMIIHPSATPKRNTKILQRKT